MCGRFVQNYTWREVNDLYDLTSAARNLRVHYNIAPTDTVGVARLADGLPGLSTSRPVEQMLPMSFLCGRP